MRYLENPASNSFIPYPESYRDAIQIFKSDCYRYKGEKSADVSIWKVLIYAYKDHCLGFLLSHRMSQVCGAFRLFACRMLKYYSKQYGLQIPKETKIGWGLYLAHGINIVINETAIIGNNCNIGQGLTIGANEGMAATIGDCVYIGPSVCVVEDVKIGNNSTIGAGAVVVKDVQENVTVAGVPAKVISPRGKKHYIRNKWSF